MNRKRIEIQNCTKEDISKIFELYKLATDFQKIKFPENQWPVFEEALIRGEITENRQFKLLIDDQIACVWAITFSDPNIWEEDDNPVSIYIHRIATNPDFRGNDFVKIIVDWAVGFAKGQDKQFIRMDTCGNNQRLIDHYSRCGFDFLGIKKLKNTEGLPTHYHGADVCLFEIRLDEA
ncbi:Acetyltransferase (GNAT) family protein [Zobellia uliginosa]|uniref:Acetyltransferase (GNAT) family protein n=1 Tax=Zobellia uliginosa TaxID=143224 RepID=A0ABY1L4K8_9FLAO|nr:GNAT family N-acetyltransferase [Zobellia uliginosa]SIT03271.1 Acetyltransferase (GNAT) family protein [Zobellia uliginosa]